MDGWRFFATPRPKRCRCADQHCRIFDNMALSKQQYPCQWRLELESWLGGVHFQIVLFDSLNQRCSLHAQQLCASGNITVRLLQGALNEVLFDIAEHGL